MAFHVQLLKLTEQGGNWKIVSCHFSAMPPTPWTAGVVEATTRGGYAMSVNNPLVDSAPTEQEDENLVVRARAAIARRWRI